MRDDQYYTIRILMSNDLCNRLLTLFIFHAVLLPDYFDLAAGHLSLGTGGIESI